MGEASSKLNVTGTQKLTWTWQVALRDNTGNTESQTFTVTYNSPTQGIQIGDRIEVNQNLNVRLCPDTDCDEISDPEYPGVAPGGTVGTVVDGPQYSAPYTWWEVNWDAGYTGWSVENGMEEL